MRRAACVAPLLAVVACGEGYRVTMHVGGEPPLAVTVDGQRVDYDADARSFSWVRMYTTGGEANRELLVVAVERDGVPIDSIEVRLGRCWERCEQGACDGEVAREDFGIGFDAEAGLIPPELSCFECFYEGGDGFRHCR